MKSHNLCWWWFKLHNELKVSLLEWSIDNSCSIKWEMISENIIKYVRLNIVLDINSKGLLIYVDLVMMI